MGVSLYHTNQINIMTNLFNSQDLQMIADLKAFATATKFEIKNESDMKTLLINWVNHRVALTPQTMDKMFADFLTSKGL